MSDRRTESIVGIESADRGVSEVVAFVLVFAMILGSVGILYSTAFGAMSDYQETEQQINAERAMEALADNFNDVIRDNGVNQRSGELSLREGTVSTSGSGTTLDITVNKTSGPDDSVTADLGEFTYRSDDRRIAYEGGGLVSAGDDGDWSLVRKRPQLKCGDDTAVISLVTISSDDRSISSSSGLEFTMEVEDRSSTVYTGVDDVSVSVNETDYDDAWTDILSEWDDSTDTKGTCDFDDDDGRVVVTLVDVDVHY
ncbi:DUF7289 family protein [Haloterrigena alkaliphila]|uniref:Uncharacterized protein n=1 Tax=Haloterrigena alkaliphila TaxID=2816475 RepID=A0A8A2VAI1_9EURY|nr:hypothetical protein [Haloterrigena alkaliphila]QSW98096.1 hypothetical protein J0X25_11815 [Haloterrigena alkaliphila]